MIVRALLSLFLVLGSVSSVLAEATLVYDRQGKVSSVIRPSPSGFLVYDRDGRVVQALRETPDARSRRIVIEQVSIEVVGTSLQGGVGDSGSGVGSR